MNRLAPQVGPLGLSANRHHRQYAAWGVAVHADVLPGKRGPLAGLLTGLVHCTTPWLVGVPCDVPDFPLDLVQRLAQAQKHTGAPAAMAATRDGSGLTLHPVFCLLQASLKTQLQADLTAGERRAGAWLHRQGCALAVFDNADAFANINTLAQLRGVQAVDQRRQELPNP